MKRDQVSSAGSSAVHVGLIGGGGISATHARALTEIPDVRIAAVQGTNAEKVRALCSTHGATPYSDLDAFLDHRPMHLVVVGSPSGLHAEHGIAAVGRGLHVLVEKPIDVTTARADALIAAADRAHVRLGVIFQDRFRPDLESVKRLLDDGALGRPLLVDARVPWYRPAQYYSGSRWRGTLALDGGGALINQAIHTVDLLVWLLGDVVRVQARTATLLHAIEAEDSGAAILEFASGVLGVFAFTTAAFPGYPRRVSVTGERGTAVMEGDTLVSLDVVDGARRGLAEARSDRDEQGRERERSSSATVSDTAAHRALFEDFVAAIREDRPPRIDGREGRRALALVEQIYKAASTPRT